MHAHEVLALHTRHGRTETRRLSPRARRRTLFTAVCLGAGLALGGCGGSSEDAARTTPRTDATPTTGTTPTTAASPDDQGPRVEGLWRSVVTTTEGDVASGRRYWHISPRCESGVCGFTVKVTRTKNSSGPFGRLRFSHDETIGDYTATVTGWAPCEDEGAGVTIAERAYRLRQSVSLRPVEAVTSPDGTFATELVGTSQERETLRPSLRDQCAAGRTNRYDIRVVRADPPPGERAPVGE